MTQDTITVVTACIAALAGYFLRWQTNSQNYERETQINERDLLSRIDGLQKQIIDMASENAQLRAEIAGLRHELRYIRGLHTVDYRQDRYSEQGERSRRYSDTIDFKGDDYAGGDY